MSNSIPYPDFEEMKNALLSIVMNFFEILHGKSILLITKKNQISIKLPLYLKDGYCLFVGGLKLLGRSVKLGNGKNLNRLSSSSSICGCCCCCGGGGGA